MNVLCTQDGQVKRFLTQQKVKCRNPVNTSVISGNPYIEFSSRHSIYINHKRKVFCSKIYFVNKVICYC